MMGSFGVCVYHHDGVTVHSRIFDFYTDAAPPTSRKHLIYRLMRSLRDSIAEFHKTVLSSSQIRVVYSGECTYFEPVHTQKVFPVPTTINKSLEAKIIQEIMTEHKDSLHTDYSICGYVLHSISSKGFRYEEDECITEAIFHGVITYCHAELRAWVDRTLYLAGAHALPIRHRAQSSMIPSVMMDMLLTKSKGSVLLYELGGIYSLSSLWLEYGLEATSQVQVGVGGGLSATDQGSLVQDIVNWFKDPKGKAEVVFVMDAGHYQRIHNELDVIMHKVQHTLPHYNFGAMVYVLDYTNPEDVYRLFSMVYETGVVGSK